MFVTLYKTKEWENIKEKEQKSVFMQAKMDEAEISQWWKFTTGCKVSQN